MGIYSSVYAKSLKAKCQEIKKELATHRTSSISAALNNSKIWNSSARNECINAINNINSSQIINGSIINLEKKLNNLEVIADKITSIQSKEGLLKTEENKSKQYRDESKISRLKKEIKALEIDIDNLIK